MAEGASIGTTNGVKISGLPYGNYTVTETGDGGLTLVKIEKDGTEVEGDLSNGVALTVGENAQGALNPVGTFTNNKVLGSLYIKKTVEKNNGADDVGKAADGDYTFHLEKITSTDPTTGEQTTTNVGYITIFVNEGRMDRASMVENQDDTPPQNELLVGDNGALVTGLEPGRYQLTEVENNVNALPGYALRLESVTMGELVTNKPDNDSISFDIVALTGSNTAPTVKVNFTNNLYKNSIQVLKIDQTTRGTTKTPIKGAEFTLIKKGENGQYTEDSNAVTQTSGDDGVLSFDELYDGEYRLEETHIPDGYSRTGGGKYIYFKIEGGKVTLQTDVDDNTIAVITEANDTLATVTYDATNKQFVVGNTPGARLPSTGGMGTGLIYATGTGLLLLAVIAWVMKAKKRDYGAY